MNKEMSRLLTRKEAAEYLGLKPQTLATWAITGRYGLPVVKCGRAVRYRLSDLENWLSARTVGAVPQDGPH
jgi:excisionase family DNA binding protein